MSGMYLFELLQINAYFLCRLTQSGSHPYCSLQPLLRVAWSHSHHTALEVMCGLVPIAWILTHRLLQYICIWHVYNCSPATRFCLGKACAISHRSWRVMWYHGVNMIQGTDAQNKRGSDAAWTTNAIRVVRSVLNPPLKPVQICNTNHSNSVTWLHICPILQDLFVFQKICQVLNRCLKYIILVLDILNWKVNKECAEFCFNNKMKTYMQHISSEILNAFHMMWSKI